MDTTENTGKEELEGEAIEEKRVNSLIDDLLPGIKKVYQYRKLVAISTLITGIIAFIILWFIIPSYYESTVVILPEPSTSTSSTLSSLGSIASLAGINLSTAGGSSTAIYENLMHSEAVLEPVIYSKYKVESLPDSVNLIDYYDIDSFEDYPPRIRKRLRFLAVFDLLNEFGGIKTELDANTGILTITVRMPSSRMSANVANNLAESLDNYIRIKRKSTAINTRKYIEKRTKTIADSLAIAEEKLKDFREQNRIVSQSPQLLLEQGRLMRNVDILQTAFTTLATQLEIAKIEEVKDIPVVNQREQVKEPVIAAGPRRKIFLILIIVFAIAFEVIYILFKPKLLQYVRYLRQ